MSATPSREFFLCQAILNLHSRGWMAATLAMGHLWSSEIYRIRGEFKRLQQPYTTSQRA